MRQRSAPWLVLLLLVASPTLTASTPPLEGEGALRPAPLRPAAAPPTDVVPGSRELRSVEDPQIPSVAIRVRVPAESPVGKELTYRMTVENCAKAPAHHVMVRVTLPAQSARFVRASPEPTETAPVLVWKLGTLGGCSKRELVLTVAPTGEGEISCCARVQFEHGQCVRTKIGQASTGPPRTTTPPPPPPPSKEEAKLRVRKSGPKEAPRYDILQYQIEIQNIGNATARRVILRDVLPAGFRAMNAKPAEKSQSPLTWELGDLAPGRSHLVEYQVVAMEPGTFTNQASVEAQNVTPQQISHSIRIGEPKLAIRLLGPKTRGVGRPATYHLDVTNTGDIPATNVQLSDELKPDIEFVSANSGGRLEGSFVRWNLGTLAPRSRRTVAVQVKARRAGTFRNVVTANADRGLVEQAFLETKFDQNATLTVELDPAQNPLEVNQQGQIRITVFNAGKVQENDVDVLITLPEGLKFLELPSVKGFEVKGSTIRLPRRTLEAAKDSYVTLRFQADKVGPQQVIVEASSSSTKGIKSEETLLVEPAPSTSKKPSS